jgi:hypothetical protein
MSKSKRIFRAKSGRLPRRTLQLRILTRGMLDGVKISRAGRVEDKRKRRSYGANEKAVKMVEVSEGTSSKKARVHILCALAFHGVQPSNEHLVKHLNKDNNDNQSNNLAWVHRTESSAGIGSVKRVRKFVKDTGILLTPTRA